MPRPLRDAIGAAIGAAAPAGALARVQAGWSEAAGPAVAAVARPVSERDGLVTVACESAIWAQELELLKPDLEARLEARLRFVVGRS